jgi:hypothetical protein
VAAIVSATEKTNRVVVLQFGSGPRVDIVADMTENEAIADFAGRALASEYPPALPLIEASTAAIPRDRLIALLNGETTALPPPIVARPSLSAAGIVQAVRAYMAALGSHDRSNTVIDGAKADFIAFFDRYGVDVDFTVARPMTPWEEWKGGNAE